METKRLEVGWLKFAIFVKTQRTKEQKSIHFVWLSDFFSLFFVRKNLVLLPFRSDLGKCLQILRVSHNSQLNQFRKFEEFWIQFNFFFSPEPKTWCWLLLRSGLFRFESVRSFLSWSEKNLSNLVEHNRARNFYYHLHFTKTVFEPQCHQSFVGLLR
jgi:hypothetical protein